MGCWACTRQTGLPLAGSTLASTPPSGGERTGTLWTSEALSVLNMPQGVCEVSTHSQSGVQRAGAVPHPVPWTSALLPHQNWNVGEEQEQTIAHNNTTCIYIHVSIHVSIHSCLYT